MQRKIYELITNILAPPIFTILVGFLLIRHFPGKLPFIYEFLTIILFISIVPLGIIYVVNRLGWTQDPHIPMGRNRVKVYLLVLFSYLLGAITFWYFSNYLIFVMFIIYLCIVLTLGVINLFWKISVHTAGIAGPVTILAYTSGTKFALFYLLLLPVYLSRYKLNAHSHNQLLGGILVSFSVTLFILLLFL